MKKIYKKLKANIRAFLEVKKAKTVLEEYLKSVSSKRVLLVSHQLTTTGSPLMLFYLAKKLQDEGLSPFVISYRGGSLQSKFEELGIKVVTGDVFQSDENVFKEFAKNFEKIIVNTIVCYKAAELYPNSIWWIQEGQNVEKDFMPIYPTLEKTLRNAKNIYVVSEYAKDVVKKYNSNVKIITLGVPDVYDKFKTEDKNEKIKFALVGDLCDCKAQDILAEAILSLDKKYIEKSEYHFVCSKKGHRYRNISKKLKQFKNVFFDGLFNNQDDKWREFSKIDVFVVPSRDESCSLIALEACMLEKPVIVSQNVGAKYIVDEGANGYVVETENSEALKIAIQKIIDKSNDLVIMGKISRENYQNKASLSIFEQSLAQIINDAKSQ